MIGIFKAVKSYDASKGKLKNYLAACVKNQILDAVRSANAKGNSPLNSALSLSVWVDGEDIGDNIESDELTPLDTLIENEGRHDFLTMLHSKLNDTETEILKGFLGGDSYKIIASNCGVSEILYIIQNGIDDDQKSSTVEKYSKLVETLNGKVESVDKWGTKKYAYPIDYKNEGYYVLMNFEADDTVPAEIRRQMGNDENVVRQMIIKK